MNIKAEPLFSVQSVIWTTAAAANTKHKDGRTVLRSLWVRRLEKASNLDIKSEHNDRGGTQKLITYDVFTEDLDR